MEEDRDNSGGGKKGAKEGRKEGRRTTHYNRKTPLWGKKGMEKRGTSAELEIYIVYVYVCVCVLHVVGHLGA